MKNQLLIGLMSGTSVDGIDASVVEFLNDKQLNVIGSSFTAYPDEIRQQINQLALSENQPDRQQLEKLDADLAQLYAQSSLALISDLAIDKAEIAAIANHGQTVRHAPNANPPYSLQLGDGQKIADLTNITTIGQFRQADLEQGGQGAPLMPAFHKALLGQQQPCCIINIGGIANITVLDDQVIGFDCGPGNTLMDQWAHKHLNQRFDKNGVWADKGHVIDALLSDLLSEPYFAKPAPKSTGPDYFNLSWLEAMTNKLDRYPVEDIQATLLALTTESIADAIEKLDMASRPIYICGGGSHNGALVNKLKQRLTPCSINKTDKIGIPADWVESIGFAWLGYCYLHNIPANLPEVTGAKTKVILGNQWRREIRTRL